MSILNTDTGKIVGGLFILLGLTLFSGITAEFAKQTAELRATHTPTKYEYKVLSVNHINSFWGGNYYEVNYIDDDNIIYSKQFRPSELKRIFSNESKLVIENPELNGYPLRNTLYWSDIK